MINLVIEGKNWGELELQANAWLQPGRKLFLEVGLPVDLSKEKLNILQSVMLREGMPLNSPVQIGTGVWPNTLRVEFKNPKGFGISPSLILALILAIGAVGIGGILGWRIGNILEKNFLPILIAGGIFAIILARRPQTT